MNTKNKDLLLIEYLKQFTTAARFETIQNFLQLRTRYVTVVTEDLFQSHNISAIMRSCEGFGIQDIHCITDMIGHGLALKKNIALGSSKWLTIHHYKKESSNPCNDTMQSSSSTHFTSTQPTIDCLQKLKQKGYRIIATSPHATTLLSHLSINTPIALVFGTEDTGLSPEAFSYADETITIPMYGFTESFNVSVSAALCMYDITTRLRQSSINWHLSAEEKTTLMLNWLRASIDRVEYYERLFLKQE